MVIVSMIYDLITVDTKKDKQTFNMDDDITTYLPSVVDILKRQSVFSNVKLENQNHIYMNCGNLKIHCMYVYQEIDDLIYNFIDIELVD